MTAEVTAQILRETLMGVVEKIVTDHTEYPLLVQTRNRSLVDQAGQVNPYLVAVIKPMAGDQAELGGDNPYIKRQGQLQLSAVVKDGEGVGAAEDLLQFVLPYFSTKQFGRIQCLAAYPVGGREVQGWWYESMIIPYWYFSRDR